MSSDSDHILTAGDIFGVGDEQSNHERLLAYAKRSGRPVAHIDQSPFIVLNSLAPAIARVDHGRWLADCPCGGAELLIREQRGFLCGSCLNDDIDGGLRPVLWPTDHAAIERELVLRPRQRNRNWQHGEKLSDLQRERKEHKR